MVVILHGNLHRSLIAAHQHGIVLGIAKLAAVHRPGQHLGRVERAAESIILIVSGRGRSLLAVGAVVTGAILGGLWAVRRLGHDQTNVEKFVDVLVGFQRSPEGSGLPLPASSDGNLRQADRPDQGKDEDGEAGDADGIHRPRRDGGCVRADGKGQDVDRGLVLHADHAQAGNLGIGVLGPGQEVTVVHGGLDRLLHLAADPGHLLLRDHVVGTVGGVDPVP